MKLLMMKMMMQWELVCYKTEWQQHHVLRNCSSALTILALPAYQIIKHVGGRIWTANTTHLVGPAGSHTSQLDLTTGYRVYDKTGYFCTIILWLGKLTKPFFFSWRYINSYRFKKINHFALKLNSRQIWQTHFSLFFFILLVLKLLRAFQK